MINRFKDKFLSITYISDAAGINSFEISVKKLLSIVLSITIIYLVLAGFLFTKYSSYLELTEEYHLAKIKLERTVNDYNKMIPEIEAITGMANETAADLLTYSPLISIAVQKNEFANYINYDRSFEKPDIEIKDIVSGSLQIIKNMNYSINPYIKSIKGLDSALKRILSIPDGLPVQGKLNSVFGLRPSPFGKYNNLHRGIDIGGKINTPVKAGGYGVVEYVGVMDHWGKTIIIDHGFGIKTQYGHLNTIDVKKGDIISKDKVIGKLGNTGRSTGPHLHYQVWVNGIPYDPLLFIDKEVQLKLKNLKGNKSTGSLNLINSGGFPK